MAGMGQTPEFFEEDEPVEDIVRAFETSEHGVTEPAQRGRTLYLDTSSFTVSEQSEALPFGELVSR